MRRVPLYRGQGSVKGGREGSELGMDVPGIPVGGERIYRRSINGMCPYLFNKKKAGRELEGRVWDEMPVMPQRFGAGLRGIEDKARRPSNRRQF